MKELYTTAGIFVVLILLGVWMVQNNRNEQEKKIGKYTYCFDKTGKLVTNKPYYKVNSKTYYKIKKNGQATRLSTVETMAAVRLQKCKCHY